MKKICLLPFLFLSVTIARAQKKLVPVVESVLTGIALPSGSKKDNRALSVAATEILLEMELKKAGITLTSTEVLELPSISISGFDKDSLMSKLLKQGWSMAPMKGDSNYTWLQKNNSTLITYFAADAKVSNLYFGVAHQIEKQNGQVNSMTNSQTQNSGNTQNQLPVNTSPDSFKGNNNKTVNKQPASPSVKNAGFAFTTTNFDDGWTSTVQENWVDVKKGDIKILIHYPNKQVDAYNPVLLDGLKNAWDILVAPRYKNATNFEFKPQSGWESIEFAEADLVENESGKRVHVKLFKKNYSNGSGKYLEFITPDKNSFNQIFGNTDNSTGSFGTGAVWDKMAGMAFYNKFAVAASDLSGTWTNDYAGLLQYVNAYTGANVATSSHASNEQFKFGPGNVYQWDLGVASGYVGNIKFQSVKSNGTFLAPNNWQVYFSDIEGKPRTYNAFFSYVKGARILWLDDRAFGKKE